MPVAAPEALIPFHSIPTRRCELYHLSSGQLKPGPALPPPRRDSLRLLPPPCSGYVVQRDLVQRVLLLYLSGCLVLLVCVCERERERESSE